MKKHYVCWCNRNDKDAEDGVAAFSRVVGKAHNVRGVHWQSTVNGHPADCGLYGLLGDRHTDVQPVSERHRP